MLAYMIARDTMHQNQWLAAIKELEADGLEETPCPSNFPQSLEDQRVSYQFWNCSEGTESAEGRLAQGPTPDGKGEFDYLADPQPMSTDQGLLNPVDPRLYGTPPVPVPKSAHE
jgi:Mn-containing catalase